MPPGAYAELCKTAKIDGFDQLGDWLAQLPGIGISCDDPKRLESTLTGALARKRFVAIAAQTCVLLEALYDLADFDTHICQEQSGAVAFYRLDAMHWKLKRILRKKAG